MLPFFRDLARDPSSSRTVIVVDESGTAPPRQYQLQPRRLFVATAAGTLLLAALLTALVVLTPVRRVILGPDPETLRETARLTAVRAAALSDSLEMQREYLAVIRATLTGVVDTAVTGQIETEDGLSDAVSGEFPEPLVRERTDNWGDHEPGALSPQVLSSSLQPPTGSGVAEGFLAHLQFPALPPVTGFFARGYDASRGHFGIDIVIDEDTPVRSIGDGYIVFADWTNDGGYVVAVQHADGFLSVYKHNRRLLKRVGDRVRSRETVAMSGNTGEITTGPHLHFELWRNGLAQDPRQYLVGL
jgi:murein DD-endopeptidase MepM/ murein hydrolase activator NlpD